MSLASRSPGKRFRGGIADVSFQEFVFFQGWRLAQRNWLGTFKGVGPTEGKGVTRTQAEGELEMQCKLKGGSTLFCMELWDHEDPSEFSPVGVRGLALYNPWSTGHCICTTPGWCMTFFSTREIPAEELQRTSVFWQCCRPQREWVPPS